MELNKVPFIHFGTSFIYFRFLFNLLINEVNKVPNFLNIISNDLFIVIFRKIFGTPFNFSENNNK